MPMTPERWNFLSEYAIEVFGGPDPDLGGLMERAVGAGLPRIAVSPDVGQFLRIVAALTGTRVAIELGTLGGYSAIWIARGMSPDGRLYTVEADQAHADFAEAELARAGVDDRVEVVRGAALDVLPDLAETLGSESVDFVFIDAVKDEYVDYFEMVRPLVRPGGVVVADNVYGTGQGWIDEGFGTDPFNRRVATDPGFDAVAVPIREGVLIARRHD